MRRAVVEPGLPRHVAGEEPLWVVPQKRRGVLAVERPGRLAPRGLERAARHDLDVEPVGPGRRVQVRHVVDVGLADLTGGWAPRASGVAGWVPTPRRRAELAEKLADHAVDRRRIDQRAVRRDLDHRVGAGRARCGEVAIEAVGRVAAHAGDPRSARDADDRVVDRQLGRRDHDLARGPRGAHPLDHALEQRRPGDRHQDLARQPRRAGASLDDDRDLHAAPTRVGAVVGSGDAALGAVRGRPITSRQTSAMWCAARPCWTGSIARWASRSR